MTPDGTNHNGTSGRTAAAPGAAPPAGASPQENRILVMAPTGRDGLLASAALERAGLAAAACPTTAELAAELRRGAAALLIAEEALGNDVAHVLDEFLIEQPPWSDLPLIVLTLAAASSRAAPDVPSVGEAGLPVNLAPFGNVTLLERPIRVATLVSAARTAVRSRQRQYQTRDLLARLRDSVRQRDQFLAVLSHELRNPLATIRNAIHMIQAVNPQAEADVLENREIIIRQTEHLARLLDDLLDVARITSGKIVLRRAPVDLRDLARRCARSVARSAADHRHDLRLDLGPEPVTVEGDTVRLEQVVCNLLTNAIKYTPPGGHITLSVSREPPADGHRHPDARATAAPHGHAVIRVTDNGIGMGPDMLPRVFDLFAQADRSLDRSQGGMGLGLTLVKTLVEMHAGTVTAHSDGPDTGSTFTVRLPLSAAAPARPAAPEKSTPAKPARGRHVLLVEDSPDARKVLGRLIQHWGHKVDLAGDGNEGVQKAVAARPEIALVDIGLPGLDGFEVGRQIRAALGRNIGLIALTGYGQPDDVARTRAAGFDLHLVKPVDPATLAKLLAEFNARP